MSGLSFNNQMLLLVGSIIVAFGVIVAVVSLIFRRQGKDCKSIWTKYLAWFALIPPILLPLLYSRTAYQVVILILSLWSFREFSRAVGLWKDKALMGVCALGIAVIYYPVFGNWYGLYQAMPVYVIALVLAVPVMRGQYEHMIQKTCLSMLGIAYFGWFLSHLAFLSNHGQPGVGYILFLLILVEANDALAYLWGNLLGRHKLIPLISPNKTVEGALGALLSVVGLALLLRFLVTAVSVWHVVLLGVMISIFGMCGDLVISFIKRDLGIKDMGTVIPGHGGILDRFDSLLFTAPIYFHFIRYFYLHG